MRYLLLLLLVGCSSEPEPAIELDTCEEVYQQLYKFGELVNNLAYIGVTQSEIDYHIRDLNVKVDKAWVVNVVYSQPPKTYQTGQIGNMLVEQAKNQHTCE